MKRRNAETGKVRRPLKRTKITERMYGNSFFYLKFIMLWATVVLVDYMFQFRFEFLWPLWMMLRTVYDSFKFQGISFSVFFICTALTSDVICFFFLPLSWMFIVASTYVWVQCVWYTVADKGFCLPTVLLCCGIAYVESYVRYTDRSSSWASSSLSSYGWGGWSATQDLHRHLAAHCVGFPAVMMGFSLKSFVSEKLRLRRQRQVRAENDLFFQLMREALPESALEQNHDRKSPSTKDSDRTTTQSNGVVEERHMNGGVGQTRRKPCKGDHSPTKHEHNNSTPVKLDKLEKVTPMSNGAVSKASVTSNGTAPHSEEHYKVNSKLSKCDKKDNVSTTKEEKRRNRNKEKDKDIIDSNKSTEQVKEQLVRDLESTKDNLRNKESNNSFKEKERDREKEREQREARECIEELKRVKAELAAARSSEAEAKRALAAVELADKQRKADHQQLRIQHTQLQNKVNMMGRTCEERRRENANNNNNKQKNGECERELCRSRLSSLQLESAALKREVARAKDRNTKLQRDINTHTEQLRSLEARQEASSASNNASSASRAALAALQERSAHLERALSAETRVKLDLLSALGEAKRQLAIREGVITKQEKEIEELKAQMLAVMPSEYINQARGVPNRRIQNSPLDPNASVYTPKQLCSDA